MARKEIYNVCRDDDSDDLFAEQAALCELAEMWPSFSDEDQERLLATHPGVGSLVQGAKRLQLPIASAEDSVRAFALGDHSDQSLN